MRIKSVKEVTFVVRAALLLSMFLMASVCVAQTKKQAAAAAAMYGDVIAKPGQSEVVVENPLNSAVNVIVNGQLEKVVRAKSTDRFVVPDGNHNIKVQSLAKNGGTSRDVQFYTQAKRTSFKVTSSNQFTVHLSRESIYDITVPNTADPSGRAPAEPTISETALGKDRDRMLDRLDTYTAAPAQPAQVTPTSSAPKPAAQQQQAAAPAKPVGVLRIAVYVTGNKPDPEKKALATKMLVALANSGKYVAVERSDDFLNTIDSEQAKQRSGSVDDKQISDVGRQFGVQAICVVDITDVLGSGQVSARIIDVETAVVLSIAEATSPLRTIDDLSAVAYKLATALLKDK